MIIRRGAIITNSFCKRFSVYTRYCTHHALRCVRRHEGEITLAGRKSWRHAPPPRRTRRCLTHALPIVSVGAYRSRRSRGVELSLARLQPGARTVFNSLGWVEYLFQRLEAVLPEKRAFELFRRVLRLAELLKAVTRRRGVSHAGISGGGGDWGRPNNTGAPPRQRGLRLWPSHSPTSAGRGTQAAPWS